MFFFLYGYHVLWKLEVNGLLGFLHVEKFTFQLSTFHFFNNKNYMLQVRILEMFRWRVVKKKIENHWPKMYFSQGEFHLAILKIDFLL